MAKYVKFMRGTIAAYNKLPKKDDDTLYFLSDNNNQEGSLYLGTKLIAGADSIYGATSLGELLDVVLTPELDYDALLMYDSVEMKWRDYSFDALTFRVPSENLQGAAGFVPAPQLSDINKFLRGDGTWATVGSECQIFDNIKTSANQSHSSALEQHTSSFILNKGDIAIVQDFIINGKYQYTSYIYNGEKWCPLDKEYDAENIYLKSDFILNDDANTTIPSAGKNVAEAFQIILSQIETAVLADLKTVTFDGKILGLKDFGKYYYKYIPESGSKDEGNYIAARYEKQIVDANHPWKSGLEPRVVNENGLLVLGWYEPNPTTIEGVNSQIEDIQNTVNDLTITAQNLSNRLDNTFTKSETNAAIAAAAHLKRIKVEDIDDIDPDADGADQYIYMVPSGLTAEDNKYYEYMVVEIDGVKIVERVGSWEVDLDDYLTKSEAQETYNDIADQFTTIDNELSRIDAKAEPNIITSVDTEVFKIVEKKLELISIPKTINLTENETLLEFFVKKEAKKSLVDDDQIAKLSTIEEDAEKNIINAIDANEFDITHDIERKLSIKQIDGSKIKNLKNNVDFTNAINDISTLNDNLSKLSQQVSKTQSRLEEINATISDLNTTVDNMDDRLSLVEQSITWVDL